MKLRNDTETKTFKVLMANRDLICLCPSRKSTIKINADVTSITLPPSIQKYALVVKIKRFSMTWLFFYIFSKDIWSLSDDLATELSLIPTRTRRRGLVNRGMWENLRSNLLQGVLKKGTNIVVVKTDVHTEKKSSLDSKYFAEFLILTRKRLHSDHF